MQMGKKICSLYIPMLHQCVPQLYVRHVLICGPIVAFRDIPRRGFFPFSHADDTRSSSLDMIWWIARITGTSLMLAGWKTSLSHTMALIGRNNIWIVLALHLSCLPCSSSCVSRLLLGVLLSRTNYCDGRVICFNKFVACLVFPIHQIGRLWCKTLYLAEVRFPPPKIGKLKHSVLSTGVCSVSPHQSLGSMTKTGATVR
jgi:hypothetical protein